MLESDPKLRPSAAECLKYDFLVTSTPSMEFDTGNDEESDITGQIKLFQDKYSEDFIKVQNGSQSSDEE
jgi:hypothetical protein